MTEGDDPFLCAICSERNEVIKRKQYPCNVCCKRLMSLDLLEAHMYTHVQETPFMCSICKFAFARQDARNRHESSHKRHHQCKICDKLCRNQKDLKEHIQQTHSLSEKQKTSEMCKVCERECETVSKEYKQMAEGDDPFLCETCSETKTQALVVWQYCMDRLI